MQNEITSMIITMVVLIALWFFIGVMMVVGATTNTNYFAPDPVSFFDLSVVEG